MNIVIASGGFDPLHLGHLRYLKKASELAQRGLYVIVNNDNWLRAKKGYNFLSQKDRLWTIKYLEFVEGVFLTTHKQGTKDLSLNEDLIKVHTKLQNLYDWSRPDYILVNGGDRTRKNIPEIEVCEKLGIKLKFGVGGRKINSSSLIARRSYGKSIKK